MGLLNRENVGAPSNVLGTDADLDVTLIQALTPAGSFPNSYTVGGGGVEWLHTYTTSLFTSPAIANRYVFLRMEDTNGVVVEEIGGVAVQTSNITTRYRWADRIRSGWGVSGEAQYLPLFSLPAMPGWTIRALADNFQAVDQFFTTAITVSRYSTGVSLDGGPAPRPVSRPLLHLGF